MFEELLPYYNEELFYIRHFAEEFAEAYPKIAGHLKLHQGEIKDPHIERLIQAFAFLNARIRLKLDDDFPEINQAFLNVLYPHYLSPIPSFSIIQFTPQADISGCYSIPKNTKIVSSEVYGEPCHFLTCYPASLWPFDVDHASFKGKPGHFPADPFRDKGTQASLQIVLKCKADKPTFSTYNIENLRFFINGASSQSYSLFDLISTNVAGLMITNGQNDPLILPSSSIKLVGFSAEESLLPYSPRSSIGYRLLTDYFVFPEKFLFFEIEGLTTSLLQNFQDTLEIYIYFNKNDPLLESKVFHNNFLLGCTPIVNLFSQKADPLPLTYTTSEIKIVPDARRYNSIEPYSITQVLKLSRSLGEKECPPYFGVKHAAEEEKSIYWYSTRRPRQKKNNKNIKLTDFYISLVDDSFSPWNEEDSLLQISLMCSNADLPSMLPFGTEQSLFQLEEGTAPLARIACLTPFTKVLYPPSGHAARWQLISHLSLNYLSLSDNEEGLTALQEILRLYDYKNSPETHALLNGLSKISTKNIISRCPGLTGYPICQGINVILEFNEENYQGTSLSLFGHILEAFFSYYCNINSFTQLTIRSTQRGFIKKWAPRIGNKTLL